MKIWNVVLLTFAPNVPLNADKSRLFSQDIQLHRKYFGLLILLCILSGSKPIKADSPVRILDTNLVHSLYVDGDFEKATAHLESVLLQKTEHSHSDSIFIFKYLGVMYAAIEATREKGKYYMMQLLTLEPTAKIMDMYASDMIYMIFKNIKDEYDMRQERLSHPAHPTTVIPENHGKDSLGLVRNGMAAADSYRVTPTIPMRQDTATPPPKVKPTHNAHLYYWVGGGGFALAGLGLVTFFLLDEKQITTKHQYNVE